MFRGLLALLVAFWSAGAMADMRGRWEGSRTMPPITIEVAGDGDARIEFGAYPGSYLLLRRGEVFHVYRLGDGSVVAVRPADMRVILEERRQRVTLHPSGASSHMVAGLQETVRGRTGISYRLEGWPEMAGGPLLVLSQDAGLAPLGRAFAVGLEMGMTYNAVAGGVVDPRFMPLFETMQTGTALRFGSLELVEVSREEIDPARLALPRLLTIEELRAGAAAPWIPADPVS